MWKWKEYDVKGNVVLDESVVARWIEKKDIHGILRQDVIINPTEACVIIKNGKIEDVMTQTRLKNVGGGFTSWLAQKFGTGEDISLIMIDTSPIDLEFVIDASTKDHAKIHGKCTMRVQINLEDATKIISLIKKAPIKTDKIPGVLWDSWRRNHVLTKDGIEDKIDMEMFAAVFSNIIRKHTADEFRGNLNIVREMEATAAIEVRKTLEMYGLTMIRLFTVWRKTDFDELMEYKRQYAIMMEKWDSTQEMYHKGVIADLRRRHEKAKTEQENRWQMVFGDEAGRQRVATMKVEGEIDRKRLIFDEKAYETREEAAATADAKRSIGFADADVIKAKGMAEVEVEEKEAEIAMKMFQEVQEAKRKRKQQEIDFAMKQTELQTHTTKEVISQAIEKGVADSEALKEMMKQMTLQKMADREVEKVKAMAEAEKARYDLDTYKSAEDRERKHQHEMTRLSADMMDAAKPNVPQTLITGGSGGGKGASGEMVQTRVHVDTSGERAPGKNCPGCGSFIKESWKICPECGYRLGATEKNACPSCGTPVKPTWKICPECGYRLTSCEMKNCTNCGTQVKSTWKVCPECGLKL